MSNHLVGVLWRVGFILAGVLYVALVAAGWWMYAEWLS